jgi:hypothetical protein
MELGLMKKAALILGIIFGSSRVMVGKKYPQPQCLC